MKIQTMKTIPTLVLGTRIYFLEEVSGKLNFITRTELSQNDVYMFMPFVFNGKIYIKGLQSKLRKNDIVNYFDPNTNLKYEFWFVEESKNKEINELYNDFGI